MADPPAKRPRHALKEPPFPCRHVLAPLVGCSDLAFRLLCRRHGATACYTEMLFADRFVGCADYRERKLQTCAEDAPLVVQFCGTDPATMGRAAALAAPHCAAVDINLGCPLPGAREGGFGAYLLERDRWALVTAMVQAMRRAAPNLPVCCKIRLLPSLADTVEFCRALEAAGVALIAVHGRHRPPADEHRGRRREAADLDAVRACVAAVGVPVLSNGNTQAHEDVTRNLAHTGAAGVMSGEGALRNPLLFAPAKAAEAGEGGAPSAPQLRQCADEYLALAERHPPESSAVVRSHLMWLLGKSGKSHRCEFEHCGPYSGAQLRLALLDADSLEEFRAVVAAVFGGVS